MIREPSTSVALPRPPARGPADPGHPAGAPGDRLRDVFHLLAAVTGRAGFQASANAFVSGLAAALGLDRASLGLTRRKRIEIAAISHAAAPGRKSALSRAIEEAMDEVLEQKEPLLFPPEDRPDLPRSPCAPLHAELARAHGSCSVLSIPLPEGGRIAGVLTVERKRGRLDGKAVAFCEAALGLAGPLLLLRRREETPLAAAASAWVNRWLARILGRGHPGWKIAAALLTGAVLFFSFATGDHRVPARTVIEGSVQMAAVAPFDGYVAEAPARAGDVVAEGDLLCRLEDREINLEHSRWKSQEEQYGKLYRRALAEGNAAEARIVDAQLKGARAQLGLTGDQLSRTRILAPLAGVVVRGDLSRSIGAPVRRGETLFEVAPLESYRVVLEVDERDLADVRPGQGGEISLFSLPDEKLPVRVSRITPIATTEGGKNRFRVEAELEVPGGRSLRPGMEGVGKIRTGRRSLFWIWTHDLRAALRLKLWSWLP